MACIITSHSRAVCSAIYWVDRTGGVWVYSSEEDPRCEIHLKWHSAALLEDVDVSVRRASGGVFLVALRYYAGGVCLLAICMNLFVDYTSWPHRLVSITPVNGLCPRHAVNMRRMFGTTIVIIHSTQVFHVFTSTSKLEMSFDNYVPIS